MENGVSQWPKLEGRFPQVSGINFAFYPNKPPGKRINPKLVKIGDEYIDMGDQDEKDLDNKGKKKERTYRMATKSYLANGKDGYDALRDPRRSEVGWLSRSSGAAGSLLSETNSAASASDAGARMPDATCPKCG